MGDGGRPERAKREQQALTAYVKGDLTVSPLPQVLG
jgi:hypothetical protein